MSRVSLRAGASLGRICKTSATSIGSMRRMSGFSSLSARTLNEIVKIDLFKNEATERVKTIWEEYHAKSGTSIGLTLSATDHDIIKKRMQDCPMFIWPIYKDDVAGSEKDAHIMMISQLLDNYIVCTYLEEYKRNPATTSPWMSMALYNDLCVDKELALVRSDFTANITRKEGNILSKMILYGYHDEKAYEFVHTFNKNPTQFNFEEFQIFFRKTDKDLQEDAEAEAQKMVTQAGGTTLST